MKENLLLIFLLLNGLPALSQCDPSLTPSSNAAVAYRPIGNRCEGAYTAKVGAPSLDIVGLTVGKFVYKLDRNETIKIENLTGTDLNIRSSAVPLNTYYRMDARIANGKTLAWELKDVLFDLMIPSGSLGIYGWKSVSNEKTYIPVTPVSSLSNASDKNIYLVVRPNARVIGVKYRYGLVGQSLSAYQEVNSSFKSGQPISVKLPADLHGNYLVEVAALMESGSDWVKMQYKVSVR